ncbi:MAG: hypothetical protein HY777_05410 [Betaproteobacteria bacterium]|nr:hypothetical protein [Betaproteobacteria bacterium]
MIIRLCIACFLLLVQGAGETYAAAPQAAAKQVRAVWLWGDNAHATATDLQKKRYLLDLLTNVPLQREFWHRLLRYGINRVYLNVNLTTEGDFLFVDHGLELSRFIDRAHGAGIEIYALFGHSSYADPGNHRKIVGERGLIEALLAFGIMNPPGFDGIQSDVEPYYDPATGAATDLLVTGPPYLELTSAISRRLNGHGKATGAPVRFEAAIPFWYSMPGDDGAPAKQVTFQGRQATMDRHIMGLVDSVAVMAYRDTAVGQNGVIALSTPTVKLAESMGKEVLVALETQRPNPKFGVSSHITLFNEGLAGVIRVSSQVSGHFAGSPAFKGIAWHHYESLINLGQGRNLRADLLEEGVLWTPDAATGVRLWDVSGNYGGYGNPNRDNEISSGDDEGRLVIDVQAKGGWGAGVSFNFSRPDQRLFLDGMKHTAVSVRYCADVESVLQVADARWHDLDDSIPLGTLPATAGFVRDATLPLGRKHPVWGVIVGEDPRYVYSGSDEYGWIDRSRLASLFLRIPPAQAGRFELIDLRLVDATAGKAPAGSPLKMQCNIRGANGS